ncbi:hypothetical protein HGM15179_016536 [Zosterops borbonicus]|uniref:Uncharacterized protein n=1 Tax=Zosterops borbonicus TaxID=364589 RepID=A0A8K1G2W6_9PASS|nr:hypothetical protein HGM15179_016536 [Zosterops borbonicus]
MPLAALKDPHKEEKLEKPTTRIGFMAPIQADGTLLLQIIRVSADSPCCNDTRKHPRHPCFPAMLEVLLLYQRQKPALLQERSLHVIKNGLHQTNLMSSCDMGIHSVNEITAEDAVYLDALSLLSQVTSNWMRGNGLNGTREGLDWILGKSSPLEGLLTRAGVE